MRSMRGHGEHDSFEYAPKELLAVYGRRDPIKMGLRALKAANLMTDADEEAMEQETAAEIDTAYRQALSESEPAAETFAEGVYTDA